jgi:TatA/E family protein of Tat protein translocase
MNILALGIGNLGGPDLFIILLIVLVLFGAKKLPDLARSLGQSMNAGGMQYPAVTMAIRRFAQRLKGDSALAKKFKRLQKTLLVKA